MNRLAEIEVLLFVAGEDGLTLRNLAEMLEMQPTAVSQQLEKLIEKYMADKASGLAILESSNRYKLVTKKNMQTFCESMPKHQSIRLCHGLFWKPYQS